MLISRSMKPIIEIKNIQKEFKIGPGLPYLSLRDSIINFFKIGQRKKVDLYLALSDITFDVYPGDSLAIIGRNGAGKSTLLKILSKITPPTKGEITCRGRIASLLEVGTGFHQELTGKENIFLNGSILGLTKKEILQKYDEIVAFAGIEKFLNTPLKRYSSGMQLRLAFAVAAHLEPEILIIDEVLAVGDSVFQQKCIKKMIEVSESGRTILFVSHNFSAVRALCKKAIVLEEGKKIFEGDVESAISFYNSSERFKGKTIDLSNIKRNKYEQHIVFDKIFFSKEHFDFGEDIKFKLKLKTKRIDIQEFEDLDLGITINDKNRNTVIHLTNKFKNILITHDNDENFYVFEIENILKPGSYFLTLFLRSKDVIQDWLIDLIEINISEGNPYGYNDSNGIFGIIFPEYNLTIESKVES